VPRGGKRQGTPGTAYSNRTDLQGVQLPPTAGPSGQYGQRAAQVAAQQAVPMGSGPQMPAAPPAPAAPEEPYSMPQLTRLDAPTERPHEPVTHGLSVGPGGGPEVLGRNALLPDTGLADMLSYLPMLEFMASQPGASGQLRQLVRRVRGGQTS
jgi:hypothetical protein